MNTNTVSTRRRFLCKAGAALSAPLAVVGADAAAIAEDHSSLQNRLADFEDVNAIRRLHQTYARLVNEGERDEVVTLFTDPSGAEADDTVSILSADRFGEEDVIELALDRGSATGRFHCTVQTETAIGPSCTLVEMAREQGEGFVRRSERRVIEAAYVKLAGVWKILRAAYRPA
jgi:hypothetical protein